MSDLHFSSGSGQLLESRHTAKNTHLQSCVFLLLDLLQSERSYGTSHNVAETPIHTLISPTTHILLFQTVCISWTVCVQWKLALWKNSMIYNIEILINVYCTYSTWWIELRKGWALGDAKKCLITQALPKPPTFSALGPFSKALIEYSSGVVFVYLRVNTRKVLVKRIGYSYTTWKRETVKFAHYILATEHNLS